MKEIAPSAAIRAFGQRPAQSAPIGGAVAQTPVEAAQPANVAFTLSGSLLRLVGQSNLAATVIADENGDLLLQFADGRAFRTSDANLQVGQKLILAITGTMDDILRALIVELDGEPLAVPREMLLRADARAPSAPRGDFPAQEATVPLPQRISALLLQPVNAGDRRQPLLVPAGSEIVLKPSPNPQQAQPAGIAGPLAAPGSLGAQPEAATPLGAGLRLTAIPLQAKSGDRWIYRTALGNLAVRLPENIAFAPALELEVVEILPAGAKDRRPGSLGGIFTHAVEDWPDLREALAAIPAAGAAGPSQLMPRLAPRGIERLFVFLAGLRRGDLGPMIEAETAEALRAQGKEPALRRLIEDLRELQRLEREQPGGEWRALALPILDHGRILPVWFFFRGGGRGQDGGADRGNRFVIELHLSALGALQLDGFMRARMLDLFVRTHRPLPSPVRADIEAIFHRGLAQAGLTGALAFQNVTPFPVSPLDELGARGGRTIAV